MYSCDASLGGALQSCCKREYVSNGKKYEPTECFPRDVKLHTTDRHFFAIEKKLS
jgi:hypothetical protein